MLFNADAKGKRNRFCMVQYLFIGPVIEVKVKPHGNAKSSKPFFHTAESTKHHLRELTSTHIPTKQVKSMLEVQAVCLVIECKLRTLSDVKIL